MYRYFLIHNTVPVEIHPINNGRKKKWTRQDEGYYKQELSGTIILNGSEYDIVRGYESANPKLKLLIEEQIAGVWQTYDEGYFYPFDCQFDLDNCTVSIKITPTNSNTVLFKDIDKKFNVINILRSGWNVIVSYSGTSFYELMTETYTSTFPPGTFTENINTHLLLNAQGYGIFGDLSANNVYADKWRIFKYYIQWITKPEFDNVDGYSYNVSEGVVTSERIREVRYVAANSDGTVTSPGTEWQQISNSNLNGGNIYKFVRYAGGQGLNVEYLYRRPGENEYYQYTSTQVGFASVYYFQIINAYINLDFNEDIYVNKFGYLYSCMNYIWKQISGCTAIKAIRSDLFFPLDDNAINPLDGTLNEYTNQHYDGTNWRIRKMLICQKSDYLNPTATEPSTLAELSLKDCLDLFTGIARCGFRIEADSVLRIEHIAYFENGLSYGAAPTGQAIDIRNEVGVRKNNKYGYDTKRMASVIRTRYSEAAGLDFIGLDNELIVLNNVDSVMIKEHTISQFTADLNYINEQPGEISKNGFVLVVAEKAYNMPTTDFRVVNCICPLTNSMQTNGLLAITTLYSKFFIYGMPFEEVKINGSTVITTRMLKNKKQVPVKMLKCSGDMNPYSIYRTGLGFGYIDDAEHSQDDNTLTLNLLQL